MGTRQELRANAERFFRSPRGRIMEKSRAKSNGVTGLRGTMGQVKASFEYFFVLLETGKKAFMPKVVFDCCPGLEAGMSVLVMVEDDPGGGPNQRVKRVKIVKE